MKNLAWESIAWRLGGNSGRVGLMPECDSSVVLRACTALNDILDILQVFYKSSSPKDPFGPCRSSTLDH